MIRFFPIIILILVEYPSAAGYGISIWLEQHRLVMYGAAFAAVIYCFVLLAALIERLLPD